MSITLEQIKLDIKEGRSTCIYYSMNTLWWTHLESDLIEASEKGKAVRDAGYAKMMLDPDLPEERKKQLESLMKMAKRGETEATQPSVPLDPTGSPLFVTDKPNGFIDKAERKPHHFGPHGIETFLKAHHQNCGGLVFSTWKQYDSLFNVN